MKPREMLEKYDEEIHGVKKEYFELGKNVDVNGVGVAFEFV